MRCHFKYAVECKFLVYEEEETPPVPCKVLYNSMCVEFNPQVKQEQNYTASPSRNRKSDTLIFGTSATGNGEDAVGDKVTQKNDIDKPSKQKPGVILKWCLLELIVLRDLCLKLSLYELVK